ncbi:MAG: glycosyltransferase, partial [Lachnospiraceae bacterium]|nr:glycosyltransferase [Lachnospiraceae bacterium]
MRDISIDVIIPAYRPGKTFRELLRMLMRQSIPVRHILIINTEEKNWDDSLIRGVRKAEVFHITKAEFDHAATRNMGAGLSDADYLLYMTQDAVPDDEKLVENLLGAFADPSVKAAYARQIPRDDCMLTEGFVRSFNYPARSFVRTLSDLPEHGIKTYFCSNVCAMYETETFRQMGGFTVPAIFNEDMVYAARIMHLGFGVAYAAGARVIHSHNYSNMQQFRRNFDNGVSQAMRP